MARSLGVHVDGGVGEGAGHVAHPAGVVEMDVGDDDSGELVRADAEAGQFVEEDRHRALAPGLDEHGCIPSIRYPAVTRCQPPSSVSISSTPSATGVPPRRTGGCSSWMRAPSGVVTSGGGAPPGGCSFWSRRCAWRRRAFAGAWNSRCRPTSWLHGCHRPSPSAWPSSSWRCGTWPSPLSPVGRLVTVALSPSLSSPWSTEPPSVRPLFRPWRRRSSWPRRRPVDRDGVPPSKRPRPGSRHGRRRRPSCGPGARPAG